MGNFIFEEINLMCIYNTGSRTGLIEALNEMRGHLEPDETELRELTESVLAKFDILSEEQYSELMLVPDFDVDNPVF